MFINNTTGLMLQTMLYLATNQTSRAITNTLYDFPPSEKSDLSEVKCYGIYGCFPLNGPFTTSTRQINVHPQKPSVIKPNFLLLNKNNMNNPDFIDLNEPEGIKNFNIKPNEKLFLIAHGYLEAGNRPWMHEMAKKLLMVENGATVVLVDWGGGSNPPYVQAVANIRLVGVMTAHIVNMIYQEAKLKNLDQVHMIGHSLGAHLSGYCGKALQKQFGLKMGRISGLDPAEPLFSETEPIVRLDKSDATFVDVIHTDANPLMSGGLGMFKPVGHVDFYPNGGFDNPGCRLKLKEYMNDKEKSFFWSMQQFLGCNHIRSQQFFTESILPKCSTFNAITCESFESFKAGKCGRCGENHHHCLEFGYHSINSYYRLLEEREINENTNLSAFLLTGSKTPFCKQQYKLTAKVSSSDESALHGGEIGTISVKLHSRRKRETEKMSLSDNSMYFEPGVEYTTLAAGRKIFEPTYATVTWEYQTSLLNPLTWRILSSPRIYLDYIEVETMEGDMYIRFCPNYDEPIIAGSENILDPNNCRDSSYEV